MGCKKEHNKSKCNCSYEPCSRKGICCDCLKYHLEMRQLPACVFSDDAEKTHDRSFENFVELFNQGKV
ncbi:cytosolic protein [Candidatus Woesearchaeota archaeon]|nr:cytosolic protein [Candidatus Woesearchaeota archaeon]